MSNLEKPRHGWEGLSNGGEIYGNRHSQKEENKGNVKLEMVNDLVNKGMDRVMAYQIVYNMSYDEATEYAARDTYNNLISCGLPNEMAMKIAYKSNEDNQKSR